MSCVKTRAFGVGAVSCVGLALSPCPPPNIVVQALRVLDDETIVVRILEVSNEHGLWAKLKESPQS